MTAAPVPREGDAAATVVGGWSLHARLRTTLMADVFRATRGDDHATVHVVHPALAAVPTVARAIEAQAPRAAAVAAADDRNLARVLGAGHEAGLLYLVTEAEPGPTLREILARKQSASGAGLPPRGAGNVAMLVAQGLQAARLGHGALSSEGVFVARSGRIAIADLAFGPAIVAAVAAGAINPPGWLAPELARAEPPTEASDVYGLGALLYDALVGRPLTRGGPRPSEVGSGVPPEIDDIIARACAERPDRRFSSLAALRELILDSLCRGLEDEAEDEDGEHTAQIAALPEVKARSVTISPGLEAAMAVPDERWLVSKGRFDFGPFSMRGLVDQIINGHIHHGHVLFDKDEGGRMKVDDHPLLGPLVESARAVREDARRAQAEVKHQARERTRGVALYGFIAAGVAAAAGGTYLLVNALSSAKAHKAAGAGAVGEASLTATVSAPKAPPKRTGGGGPRRTGGGGDNGSETLALDLGGDDDGGSETLDMGTVYAVYSRAGGALGGCLSKTGSSSAAISFIIDGPSGRVNFVKVNGQTSGALHGCLAGVLRGLKFPAIDGPRTRAEFEIAL